MRTYGSLVVKTFEELREEVCFEDQRILEEFLVVRQSSVAAVVQAIHVYEQVESMIHENYPHHNFTMPTFQEAASPTAAEGHSLIHRKKKMRREHDPTRHPRRSQ